MKKQNYQLGLYKSFAGATGGLKRTPPKACEVYLTKKTPSAACSPLEEGYNSYLRFKAKASRNRITSQGSINHLLGVIRGLTSTHKQRHVMRRHVSNINKYSLVLHNSIDIIKKAASLPLTVSPFLAAAFRHVFLLRWTCTAKVQQQ